MDSLSGPQYQDALLRIGLLCKLRYENVPEEEVAVKLQFGSVEAMHVQLGNWDLPPWLIGELPRSESEKTERRARTIREEPVELPPAYDALPLFHRALQKLDWGLGDLENRKEYLQNGRFVAHESTGPAYSPKTGIEEGTLTIPLGGQQTPLEPLPALIGAYVLTDEPLEPLLEKLNRWPQSVDKEQIQKTYRGRENPKGPQERAQDYRRHDRAWHTWRCDSRGATTGEFSDRIQNGVWYSRQLTQRGLDPATISERLREANFTREEISQIQSLQKLPQPE